MRLQNTDVVIIKSAHSTCTKGYLSAVHVRRGPLFCCQIGNTLLFITFQCFTLQKDIQSFSRFLFFHYLSIFSSSSYSSCSFLPPSPSIVRFALALCLPLCFQFSDIILTGRVNMCMKVMKSLCLNHS